MIETITFKDELTINQIEGVINKLRDAVSKMNELVIDITGIGRVDVAAIQVLIALKKERIKKGKNLIFLMSDSVKNITFQLGIKL
jgi:ABC-type transporter Mla MlaB component